MEPVDKIKNWVKLNIIKLQLEELSIIDIGFYQPGDFFELYHTNGFKRYIGIDKVAELKCHVLYNQQSISGKLGANIYDEYLSYCDLRLFKPLCYEKFNLVFNFFWETDVVDYIKLDNNVNGSINLCILSNVLHKINDKKTARSVLDWFRNNLSETCYTYISVMDKEFEYSTKVDFVYSIEEFRELISPWTCLIFEENVGGFHTALIKN